MPMAHLRAVMTLTVTLALGSIGAVDAAQQQNPWQGFDAPRLPPPPRLAEGWQPCMVKARDCLGMGRRPHTCQVGSAGPCTGGPGRFEKVQSGR